MNNINYSILIVDDDADILDAFKSLLETEAYLVDTCTTAADSFRLLETKTYASVLVDIFLPDMNGIDFIAEIRERGLATPVIIITGSSEIELARKAMRLGVFDYLCKPVKGAILLQTVHNSVTQNDLQEERKSLEMQKNLYQLELEKLMNEKVAQLKESEQKYQNIIEQSLLGVFILQNNTFRFMNRKMYEILECEANQVIDRLGFHSFLSEEQGRQIADKLSRCEKGEINIGTVTFPIKTMKKNERILEMWAGLVQYGGQPAVECIAFDNTSHHEQEMRNRQLELELINEHKLSAIGQLAAGIAHNLNTPIAVIQANAELLLMRQPDAVELQKIIKQTSRMSELISLLIEKGRKEQNLRIVSIDINALIRAELGFLEADLFFKHRVQKEFSFAEGLPAIQGQYSDFSQSLTNIIQNAIDAVQDCEIRKISIKTELVEQQINVTISDTGCGIREEFHSMIFQPFFTTKPNDARTDDNQPRMRGTGLGLSLTYNLLKPYGVKFDLISQEEAGATFILKIPVTQNQISQS
jgi:PAS domain S-box-containing protein